MPLFSSPCLLAYFLLAVVALTGVLPLATSSRYHAGVVATDDGAPAQLEEDQELLMTERFHGWMAKHGRSYATAEEKLRRLEIYRKNVEFIEAANRDGRLSYTLGENAFTDLTHEEFLAAYTSPAPPPVLMTEEEGMVITTRAGHVSEVANFLPAADQVPDYVDWREKGKVTDIKNMGQRCGSCWAFAAVAAIESAYAIDKDVEPLALSEQELIDCDTYDRGCRGGLPRQAFQWLKNSGSGITTESQYPYVNQNDRESQACRMDPGQTYPVYIKDYGIVNEMSEEKLMQNVARQPVAVRFDATDPCLKHYHSGKYDGMCIQGKELIGPCSSNNLNHAMAIVGYSGKGNDSDKYWIAKNSWGTYWGVDGYFYIRKDVANPEGLCGIVKTAPSFPVVA